MSEERRLSPGLLFPECLECGMLQGLELAIPATHSPRISITGSSRRFMQFPLFVPMDVSHVIFFSFSGREHLLSRIKAFFLSGRQSVSRPPQCTSTPLSTPP